MTRLSSAAVLIDKNASPKGYQGLFAFAQRPFGLATDIVLSQSRGDRVMRNTKRIGMFGLAFALVATMAAAEGPAPKFGPVGCKGHVEKMEGGPRRVSPRRD